MADEEANDVEAGRKGQVQDAVGCQSKEERCDAVPLRMHPTRPPDAAFARVIHVGSGKDTDVVVMLPEAIGAQHDDERIVDHRTSIEPIEWEGFVVALFDEHACSVLPFRLHAEHEERRKDHECGEKEADDNNDTCILLPDCNRTPTQHS